MFPCIMYNIYGDISHWIKTAKKQEDFIEK